VSDATLAVSSDSMESAELTELIVHRRLTNGLLSESATVECTKHSTASMLHTAYWQISALSENTKHKMT